MTEKAFDDDGKLKQPKQLSINKVGHGKCKSVRSKIIFYQR